MNVLDEIENLDDSISVSSSSDVGDTVFTVQPNDVYYLYWFFGNGPTIALVSASAYFYIEGRYGKMLYQFIMHPNG